MPQINKHNFIFDKINKHNFIFDKVKSYLVNKISSHKNFFRLTFGFQLTYIFGVFEYFWVGKLDIFVDFIFLIDCNDFVIETLKLRLLILFFTVKNIKILRYYMH